MSLCFYSAKYCFYRENNIFIKTRKKFPFFFSATRHQVLEFCPELEILTNPIFDSVNKQRFKKWAHLDRPMVVKLS